ncbi:MAG: DNA polymerase III, subunit gamma and tau [Alphaproteobacteria bacterium RIFCSPLOWO2_01_FULL_40_26]|nr:MAG: DNA polymerase III, subunit gamma and tau [Alphaproteobacteria bacterium RIFCSPHIGHO2_02_FULL_40_34]OFW95440.1 MAG: DNA polymerase III, subunit gamma and tau [Alphaproteobacteria bacterium RIFCSPLOWO2_01_FULL_40_26]OFX09288.1 MAG: DNA polymerase III, subunit gamma and tau [Alphaproteobacteria bacterium RIFCSPLOWO2_02_FULL_40_19]OFX10902.1 MAG: DNA polymerase III, subunit gamma and tau [Alphaproteobacteria bacterium RIFCSPLOWO2_12_FULL_40_11]
MSYLVLARKYRPQNFDELIGQEVLVATLTNAIRNNRLHHAYILTGIRGIGKTTTARIIAKTLNCLDQDALNNAKACGICDNCRRIASSKHQDVVEIDAASRTGVDDIREIIDSIAYAPVASKHKIYIIDEVHMLSNSAFNALLKTLEEPPAHVKFIFATTEIRKVPLTVLSRCQRFDLRRLDESEIVLHLKNILNKENFEADEEALSLISRFSEGSVRDSLSLLDQALAINNHQKFLSSDVVEKMLCLSDRVAVIELLEKILSGDFPTSLKIFSEFYSHSSDVLQLINDILEIIHKATSIKLAPDYNLYGYSEEQRKKIRDIAQKTSLNSLARIWQMLSKGISEINFSSSPKMAFEMLLARLCHLVALPDLQQVLLNLDQKKNNIAQKNAQTNDIKPVSLGDNDLISEIMRNFEGAKLV